MPMDSSSKLTAWASQQRVPVTVEESMNRTNYRKSDNINYDDGDFQTNIATDWLTDPGKNTTTDMYEYRCNLPDY